MRLANKTAVVTGAGRGIGGAIARGLATEGADLVLISRTREELEAQKTAILEANPERKCLLIECDVTDEASVKEVRRKTIAEFGKVDILVNAAGISMVADSEKLATENWQKCIDINLTGTFFMCRELGEEMIKNKRGKIINITSVTAHAGIPMRAAYSASKGGVMQLTQTLAVEWAKYNIQVNNISPGFIITEMVQKLIDQGIHKPEKLSARIPAGRMGYPEDLVGPAIFLSSSDSDYVTGTTLIVDGGWLANGYL